MLLNYGELSKAMSNADVKKNIQYGHCPISYQILAKRLSEEFLPPVESMDILFCAKSSFSLQVHKIRFTTVLKPISSGQNIKIHTLIHSLTYSLAPSLTHY